MLSRPHYPQPLSPITVPCPLLPLSLRKAREACGFRDARRREHLMWTWMCAQSWEGVRKQQGGSLLQEVAASMGFSDRAEVCVLGRRSWSLWCEHGFLDTPVCTCHMVHSANAGRPGPRPAWQLVLGRDRHSSPCS
jgi:hypothetical protein